MALGVNRVAGQAVMKIAKVRSGPCPLPHAWPRGCRDPVRGQGGPRPADILTSENAGSNLPAAT